MNRTIMKSDGGWSVAGNGTQDGFRTSDFHAIPGEDEAVVTHFEETFDPIDDDYDYFLDNDPHLFYNDDCEAVTFSEAFGMDTSTTEGRIAAMGQVANDLDDDWHDYSGMFCSAAMSRIANDEKFWKTGPSYDEIEAELLRVTNRIELEDWEKAEEAMEAADRERENNPEEDFSANMQGSRWVESFRKSKKSASGTPKAKERQQKKKAAQMKRREARKLPRHWCHDSIKDGLFESRIDVLEMIEREEKQTRESFDEHDNEWDHESGLINDIITAEREMLVNHAVRDLTPYWLPRFKIFFNKAMEIIINDDGFWDNSPDELTIWRKTVQVCHQISSNYTEKQN